jgi:predicted dehydrogenase
MLIKAKSRLFEIPEPAAGDDERLVRVEALARISVSEGARKHRFAFENQIAKLLFFICREGLKLTANKVRTSLLQRAISGERQLVFVVGVDVNNDEPVVAIGPQDWPEAEILCFPKALVASRSDGKDAFALCGRLNEYLQSESVLLAELFHYSRFSEHPLPVDFGMLAERSAGHDETSAHLAPLTIAGTLPIVRLAKRDSDRANSLFLVGAGAYACAYILPTLSRLDFDTIVDLNPGLATLVGHSYRFAHYDTSVERAFARLSTVVDPIVVIAGYHSTHAAHAGMAIAANERARVFIEKPPALSLDEARALLSLRRAGAYLEIGYNRRFAGLFQKAQAEVARESGPISVTCIVKELTIPSSHWYYWPSQGTRILGNVGHWIDLGVALIEARPTGLVVASPIGGMVGDELTLTVLFADGSRLSIIATKLGSGLRGVQEYMDIRRGGLTVEIDDFMTLTVKRGGRKHVRRRILRDKGHSQMYRNFASAVAAGRGPVYPERALLLTTQILVAAVEAIKGGRCGSVVELEELAVDD